jgi:Mn2+/Fe2+ NRAMP family transporter
VATLHLDFFFLLGFWTQFLILLWGPCVLTIGILGRMVMPLALVITSCAVRRESTKAAVVALGFLIWELALLVAGLTVFQKRTAELPSVAASKVERVLGYGSAALALLFATTVIAVLCWKNFERGLKAYLQQSSLPHAEPGTYRAHHRTISALRPRCCSAGQ